MLKFGQRNRWSSILSAQPISQNHWPRPDCVSFKLYSKELISLFLMPKFDQRDGLSSLRSAKPIVKFSKKNVDRACGSSLWAVKEFQRKCSNVAGRLGSGPPGCRLEGAMQLPRPLLLLHLLSGAKKIVILVLFYQSLVKGIGGLQFFQPSL